MDIQLWHLIATVAAVLLPAVAGYSKLMSERGEVAMRLVRAEKDIEAANGRVTDEIKLVNARISAHKDIVGDLDQKLDDLKSDMKDMRVEILREIHQLEKG